MPSQKTLKEKNPDFLKAQPYKVPEKDISLQEIYDMEREMTARKAMEALSLPELVEFYRSRGEELKQKEEAGTSIPGGSEVEMERMLRMMLLNKTTGGAPVKAKEAYEMTFPKPEKDLGRKK